MLCDKASPSYVGKRNNGQTESQDQLPDFETALFMSNSTSGYY